MFAASANDSASSSSNVHSFSDGLEFLRPFFPISDEPAQTSDMSQPSDQQPQPVESNTNVDPAAENEKAVNLSTSNVVVMANMRCHLALKDIARRGIDVEFKAAKNHVIMRLRKPYLVATIWSSGKIWCTGASSINNAKKGARRIARRLMKLGYKCRFSNYRILNVMARCRLPFRVKLEDLARTRPRQMSYEPELTPGLTYKNPNIPSLSLTLFSTGRLVIMGSSLEDIAKAVEELGQLASCHQSEEAPSDSSDDESLIAGSGDKNSQRRQYYRRRRGRARRLNPFTEIAAKKIPELADVFYEELEAEELEEQEALDSADLNGEGSPSSTGEEFTDAIVRNSAVGGNDAALVSQQPLPPITPRDLDNVRSGPKKVPRIITYNQQLQQEASTVSTAPLNTTVQTAPQFVYATTPGNQVVRYITTSGQTFTQQPQQQSRIMCSMPSQAGGNIVRLVTPMQMSGQPQQLQSQQVQPRFIISRLPAGTTILNPNTTFLMTTTSGGQMLLNGQPTQIFRTITPNSSNAVTLTTNPNVAVAATPTNVTTSTPVNIIPQNSGSQN